MAVDPRTQRTIRQLVARLDKLEAQQLATARASQASHRSLEAGPLSVYDADGVLRTTVGAQPDGTFTVRDSNGAPPPIPSAPIVDASKPGVLVVEWDGFATEGIDWPADFDRVEVHLNTVPGVAPTNANEVASFHSVNGGTITLALDPVAQYVTFTAVNTSEIESDPSVEVTATVTAPAAGLPAPSASPVPVVNGGIDSFRVSWVVQPTGTAVEVHVSTVASFTPSAGTLATTTDANGATVVRMPNGDPLSYSVAYYFRLIAYTTGGAAAPSVAVSGTLEPGDLQLNDGGTTKTTRLIVTSTTDVDPADPNNKPPLIIGDPAGAHMRLDGNEMVAMSNPTTVSTLRVNGSRAMRAWGWNSASVSPDAAGNATVGHSLGVLPSAVIAVSSTEGVVVVTRNYTTTTFGVGANRASDGGAVVNPFSMVFFAIA
jgi:hypothetical protein